MAKMEYEVLIWVHARKFSEFKIEFNPMESVYFKGVSTHDYDGK